MTIGDISGFLAEGDPTWNSAAPALPTPAPAVLAHDPGHQPWGYHLILDLVGCDLPTIRSRWKWWRFCRQLCKVIDMKPYGLPRAKRFALDNPSAAGITAQQLVTTSALTVITVHSGERSGEAYVDIFSCKHFNPDVATAFITKYLGATVRKATVLNRG